MSCSVDMAENKHLKIINAEVEKNTNYKLRLSRTLGHSL